MSKDLIEKAWSNFPGGGSSLTALMAIAEACNAQGNAYISQAQLAAAARISHATLGPAVIRLRAERWIVVSRIVGQGKLLAYQINIPKLERSIRLDRDPSEPQNDAIRCAIKAAERRTKKYGDPIE